MHYERRDKSWRQKLQSNSCISREIFIKDRQFSSNVGHWEGERVECGDPRKLTKYSRIPGRENFGCR